MSAPDARERRKLWSFGVAAGLVVVVVAVLAFFLLRGEDEADRGADLDAGVVSNAGRANAYPNAADAWDPYGTFVAADTWNGRAWGTTVLQRAPDGREEPNVSLPLTGVVGVAVGTHADEPDALFALGSRGDRMTLARANPENGKLDPAFGSGGLLDMGRGVPQAFAAQHNHQIAVADGVARRGEVRVIRLAPENRPLPTRRIAVPGVTDPVRVVALAGQFDTPRLLVAGEVLDEGGATAQPFLAGVGRGEGEDVVTLARSVPGARWKSIVTHEDGSATMVGDARSGGRVVIATAHFGADIGLDDAYGTAGVALTPVGSGDAFMGAAAAAPGGGVYVAANSGDTTHLVHLRKDATVDPGFRRPPTPGRATAIALEDRDSVILVTSVWVNSRQTIGLRRLRGLG